MWKYYLLVVATAWRAFIREGQAIRKRLIGFLVQTSILFFVLYSFPVFGAVTDEAKLALAGALAVIGSSALLFLWELVRAPADLHTEQKRRIEALYNALTDLDEAEKYIEKLSELYREGRRKYLEYDEVEKWTLKMNAWEKEVEELLRKHFSVSEVHSFRKPGSNFELRTEWDWEDVDTSTKFWLKAEATNRLRALDDLIATAAYSFIPKKSELRTLLEQENKRITVAAKMWSAARPSSTIEP